MITALRGVDQEGDRLEPAAEPPWREPSYHTFPFSVMLQHKGPLTELCQMLLILH